MELMPPFDKHENTVLLLCYLTFSVSCSVFVRARFLQNQKKNRTFFDDCTFYRVTFMTIHCERGKVACCQ